MAIYAADAYTPRRGMMRLDGHPDRDGIEDLGRKLLPEWGTYGCAVAYMAIAEAQLSADLDLLLAYEALGADCRLDDIRIAVHAMRRAGHGHASDRLTTASVRALTDLGFGHEKDDQLTSEIGYPNVKLIQEMLVTRPEDAPLIKVALDRKVYEPDGIRDLIGSLRTVETAVMDGAL